MQVPIAEGQSDDLIGFTNGVYDIKTGAFRAHNPDNWLLNHNGITFIKHIIGEFRNPRPAFLSLAFFCR